MDRPATTTARGVDSDQFELLAQARQLIDRAIYTGGSQSVTSVSNKTTRREMIRNLVATAQQDIRCVVASAQFLTELSETFLDSDFATIGKHVHASAVCDVSTAASPVVLNLIGPCGLDVRVAQRNLPDMLLIDRGQAFLRLAPAGSDSLFIWNAGMVNVLHAFYGEAWRSAFDHGTYLRLARIYQCPQTRQIIELLADGDTDEVAARTMGMSVRTYRRHVAVLMRDLNAQSRFQVGALVAQLGLLSDRKEGVQS